MACTYSRTHATPFEGEIIPTSVLIKNIPLDLKSDDFLDFMSQMKLPRPNALNFLHNDVRVFRGMAFASFSSVDQSWRVIQALNHYWLHGWRLSAQFKRKWADHIPRENFPQKTTVQQLDHSSRSDNPDKPFSRLHKKAFPASQTTREKTPPVESYNLLMRYQTDPMERAKLKKFLAQTGGYQEAIDTFAKNRAGEAQEAEADKSLEIAPILEMRAPTPGEEREIAEWESRVSRSRRVKRGGSGSAQLDGDCDVVVEPENSRPQEVQLASLEAMRKVTFSFQPANIGEVNDGKDTEEGGARDDDGRLHTTHIVAEELRW